MLDPTTLMPEAGIFDEMCGTIMLVMVLVIAFAYVRKRAKWNGYVDKFGDQIKGDDRSSYVNRMRALVGRTMFASVLFILLLLFGFLVTVDFVNRIIGSWTWLFVVVFLVAILIFQTYMILSLHKFKVLPEDRYGYIYEVVQKVTDKFGIKFPALKMDESPDINAYTTSVFGTNSVVVITKGLLDRVEKGHFEEEQLQAIIGHELGHIVNNDATITTLLNPALMFVMVIKGVLEFIVKGIVLVIIRSGQFGMTGIVRLVLAIILILLLIWILLYVGVAYVVFYILALVITLAGMWVSRQKEYAADLFGSLVMGSRLPLGLGLMNLTREVGVELVRQNIAVKEIKRREKEMQGDNGGEETKAQPAPGASVEELLSREERMKILEDIDPREAIEKDPELVKGIPMRDAQALLEEKMFEPFDEEDFSNFAEFQYSTQESISEFVMDHPLMGKRARNLDDMKLVLESSVTIDADPS